MKRILAIAIMVAPSVTLFAQDDDDMYFVPKKNKKAEVVVVETPQDVNHDSTPSNGRPYNKVEETDFHTGNLRDVDEYNRRGTSAPQSQMVARMVNDTLYITTEDGSEVAYTDAKQQAPSTYYEDGYYDDDYYYASRLYRYHGVRFMDPYLWDIRFGWYDPWYDPWYGYYAPYFHYGYASWYSWGWGWSCRPGWDMCWGHHGYYRDHLPHRPTLHNNYGRRPHTHSIANRAGVSGRVGRGAFSNPSSNSTASRGFGTAPSRRSDRSTNTFAAPNRDGYNFGRPGRSTSNTPTIGRSVISRENNTVRTAPDRSVNSNNSRRSEVPQRSSVERNTSRGQDSGSRGGFDGSSSRGSGSFGGGGSRGGSSFGGGSRGGSSSRGGRR